MALPQPHMTPEEYLRMERQSEIKHEYYAGEIFATSGASMKHNFIVASATAALLVQLRHKGCRVSANDFRVRTGPPLLYTYPDISIVCRTPQLEDSHQDILLNPTVIIEVLSPSTESYDRGRKFQQYRTLESLQEYLLIAQDTPRIEHFRRQGEHWLFNDYTGLETSLELPAVGCTLALSDVYEQVIFTETEGSES